LTCNDPGLPGGVLTAYQLKTFAGYQAALASFNNWWQGFVSSDGGATCPPDKTGLGTTPWTSSSFPTRVGQVLECQYVGAALNEPAYAWTYPTENAFIIAQGAPDSTFGALSRWWTDTVTPRSTLAVTGVTPAGGSTAGGTPVTITGAGFPAGVGVDFGDTPASSVDRVSSSEIVAVSPPGTGPVEITVVTAGGASEVVSGDLFTYTGPTR
jgi:hypothetical protein